MPLKRTLLRLCFSSWSLFAVGEERGAESRSRKAASTSTGNGYNRNASHPRTSKKKKSNLQIWDETPWCWHSSVNSFVCTAFDVSLYWSIGEQENIDKFSKRLVKVTKQHNDECKKLLTLMGVPYIEVLLLFFFPPFVQQNSNFFTVIPFDLWTYLHSSVQMLKRKALQVQYTHTHTQTARTLTRTFSSRLRVRPRPAVRLWWRQERCTPRRPKIWTD